MTVRSTRCSRRPRSSAARTSTLTRRRRCKAMGVSPADVGTLFDHFNPGASLPARFKRMIEGSYDQPSWDLAMARKDARLMQEEAHGAHHVMLPQMAALLDVKLGRGFGEQDWTVIAKDLLGK